VDIVIGSNFAIKDLYAWWRYNESTEQGIREFFNGLQALDL